jgi:RNA polymerase sigma factor (sigma-70 family)
MLVANKKTHVKSTPSSSIVPHRADTPPRAADINGDFFFIDEFADVDAGERFMAVMPPAQGNTNRRPPSGLPAYLLHLWSIPLLNQEQEFHCFRKLNYLKYLLSLPQEQAVAFTSREAMLDDNEALKQSIIRTRNFLVESNLRLVVSIAKRHAATSVETFDELVCIGNSALLRAVDLFDFRRGIRFSTYAYSAIERSIYGVYRKDKRYRKVVIGDGDSALHSCAGDAAKSDLAELEAAEACGEVNQLMHQLDDRDRRIVMARFGINRSGQGVAFHVIAKEIRLSTTRTIQLFNRSIEKMRIAATQKTGLRCTD